MKKIILSLLILLSFAPAFSQTSGGPDAYGYIWRNSNDSLGPVYNWVDITGLPGATQVFGLGDDNTVGFFNIGFQFPYYWYEVSQFKIGSNGYMIFSNGAIASPFPSIPSPALPQDFVGALMSDLNFDGGGNPAQCWYWSNNTDTCILSYINVPFWVNAAPPYTGQNTFQIILSKVDSSITFQYMDQQGASAATADFVTIGIENNSGSIGLEQAKDFYPSSLYAIKFYYPQSSSLAVNDASTNYINNPESAGLFLGKDGPPFTLSTQIKNTGNQSLLPFDVYMRVLNSAGVVQVQETLSTAALSPGATQDLTAVATFSPTTLGTYRFITTTSLAGDATPTNNTKILELDVVDTSGYVTLSYTGNQNIPAGAGVVWSGGDAGAGEEFVPPFYPCYLIRVDYFIVDDPNAVGFYSLIYDNGGPGGSPGNLLDSIFVDPSVILVNSWNNLNLATPIRIDSGSVFIGWMMNGENVILGTDSTAPRSNRTYEVLGSWAIYRDRESADQMIRAVIADSATLAVGIKNNTNENFVGEFYPSPSNGKVFIKTDFIDNSQEINFEFFDLKGQLVESKKISRNAAMRHEIYSFDVSKRSAGIYMCKITAGSKEYNRKLIIAD